MSTEREVLRASESDLQDHGPFAAIARTQNAQMKTRTSGSRCPNCLFLFHLHFLQEYFKRLSLKSCCNVRRIHLDGESNFAEHQVFVQTGSSGGPIWPLAPWIEAYRKR